MSSPEDKSLLNFIAAAVENLRARIEEMSEQMATKVDLANLREETKEEFAELRQEMATKADLAVLRSEVREEIAALRGEMATKDDLALLATTVQGDFEQVHFRFDTLERVIATRFGQVETDISRIRSVLYLLVKDKPDMLRLLGQPTPGESRPQV
jgi:uncharacterized protein YigA (DUF484 family)